MNTFFSLNGEQIVLKGQLPPIQAENVLTQSDIEHICQHLHLDAGNLMQWQWSFFTRAFIAKDVFHSHMYKTKKLNNYTVLYKQDTEGSGLGEIHFYFTLQLPTGEVYQKAMVTHLETLSQQAITGIELVDEHRMIQVIQCPTKTCISILNIQCKCIPIHVGDEYYVLNFQTIFTVQIN